MSIVHEHRVLVDRATLNISNMVSLALEHDSNASTLVVYDTRYGLTKILTEAYRNVLPNAIFVDFDTVSKEAIINRFNTMHQGDLVVLIQSSNFLLDAFRIRLHLFQNKLKVIEHVHLHRNTEPIWDVYIDALEYDPSWYRIIGPKLQNALASCSELRIEGGGATLTVSGKLESPKPNLGDYRGMENIGGTFPIGEIFTESCDFADMNGSFMIYAYADSDFRIAMYEPFRVDVMKGIVVDWSKNTPQSFIDIIRMISASERPLVREIGFGLNRAITRERYPEDITAFERILGLHLSLGEKHSVYKKEGIVTHKTKFHIDVFPFVERVSCDKKDIYKDGKYLF
jgi:aminopeptidase